jgi:hypothetical protein
MTGDDIARTQTRDARALSSSSVPRSRSVPRVRANRLAYIVERVALTTTRKDERGDVSWNRRYARGGGTLGKCQ